MDLGNGVRPRERVCTCAHGTMNISARGSLHARQTRLHLFFRAQGVHVLRGRCARVMDARDILSTGEAVATTSLITSSVNVVVVPRAVIPHQMKHAFH